MQLEVTEQERDLLQDLLDGIYRDLSYEIADTDDHDFRERLQAKRDAVGRILDAVGGPLPDKPARNG